MEGSLHAINQLDLFIRFDTAPACNGQTDERTDKWTHDDSIYRASIASRGKNLS